MNVREKTGYEGALLHVLKCWPDSFNGVISGQKMFEVRINDRDFRPGDAITLLEWNPETEKYTGRKRTVTVGYVLKEHPGIKEGYCVMQI